MAKISFNNKFFDTVILPDIFTLEGFLLEAIYVDNAIPGAACNGGHSCNNAEFYITINDINVLSANLNNLEQGSAPALMSDGIGSSANDRYASIVISKELAAAVREKNPAAFQLNIIPQPQNISPHSDITWVRLKDPKGNIIYSSCSAQGEEVDVTQLILENLDSQDRLKCADQVKLNFYMKDLEVGQEYKVRYDLVDHQQFDTISINNISSYRFSDHCCQNIINVNESDQSFDFVAESSEMQCQMLLTLKCSQSALAQIALIHNNTTLSKDIAQIMCPICKVIPVESILFAPPAPNLDFDIEFTNLSILGEPQQFDFSNQSSTPIIIESNGLEGSQILNLRAFNLTENRKYEYSINFILGEGNISIQPKTGYFYSSDKDYFISSVLSFINLENISILYATIKDTQTNLVKNTEWITIKNKNTCSTFPMNVHLTEYPRNQDISQGENAGECDLSPKNCLFD